MRNPRPGSLIAGGLIAVLAASSAAPAQEPYRQVLISASRNLNADPNMIFRSVTVSRYAVPECPVPWSVRKVRLFGGKQDGVDLVWVDNGKIQITLHPDAGHGDPDGDPGRQADPGLGLAGQGCGASELHRPQEPRRPGMAGRVQRVALPLRHGMERRTPGPTGSSTPRARRRRWTSPSTAGSPTCPRRRST